jgi:hypothetical protein
MRKFRARHTALELQPLLLWQSVLSAHVCNLNRKAKPKQDRPQKKSGEHRQPKRLNDQRCAGERGEGDEAPIEDELHQDGSKDPPYHKCQPEKGDFLETKGVEKAAGDQSACQKSSHTDGQALEEDGEQRSKSTDCKGYDEDKPLGLRRDEPACQHESCCETAGGNEEPEEPTAKDEQQYACEHLCEEHSGAPRKRHSAFGI